jgi:Protein  of unknown function (DUF3018)
MARKAAEKMIDYRRRKREQGLRLVQLWAYDRGRPEFRDLMRREAELVRGHPSTLEANEFLGELLDEALADHAVEKP